MKRYYIIRFGDLGEESQKEIKKDLKRMLLQNEANWTLIAGAGSPLEIEQGLNEIVDNLCDKSWTELEIELDTNIIL